MDPIDLDGKRGVDDSIFDGRMMLQDRNSMPLCKQISLRGEMDFPELKKETLMKISPRDKQISLVAGAFYLS